MKKHTKVYLTHICGTVPDADRLVGSKCRIRKVRCKCGEIKGAENVGKLCTKCGKKALYQTCGGRLAEVKDQGG